MKKRIYVVWLVLLISLIWVLPAAAAPLLAEESAGVNLPGWVGGVMAVIALILPIVTSLWLRNKNS